MRFLLLLAIVLSACWPSYLYADGTQCLPPMCASPASGEATESGGGLKSLLPTSLLPGVNLGKIILNPYAQVGYTKVGCNISFPLQIEEVIPINNQVQIGTMELFLRDAAFWTGNVGLNAVINPSLTLFASAGGFAPRPVGSPAILPIRINDVSLPSQVNFTGRKIEYWVMQAGASVGICGGWSVLAGYFWDHFGMIADDPRIGSVPLPNQTIRADSLTLTGVPFIGLQFNQTQLKYRFSVLYSPFAQCWSTLALRNSQGQLSQLQYTFNKPGQFFVFNGEYDWDINKDSYFSVWATGLWMRVQGEGQMQFQSPTRNIFSEREESNALIAKYSIAGGVGLGMAF